MPLQIQRGLALGPVVLSPPTQPARLIRGSRPTRITGEFRLPTLCPYPMEWESKLERNILLTLFLCHDVHALYTQPYRLPVSKVQGHRTYTPDVYVVRPSTQCLLEIKPYLLLQRKADEYLQIARSLHAQALRLEFGTEAELGSDDKRKNVALLQRYLGHEVAAARTSELAKATPIDGCTVEDLMSASGAEEYEILCLIAHRRLFMEMDVPYSRSSIVVSQPHPGFGITYEATFAASRCNAALEDALLESGPAGKWPPPPQASVRPVDMVRSGFDFAGGFPDEAARRQPRGAGGDQQARRRRVDAIGSRHAEEDVQ